MFIKNTGGDKSMENEAVNDFPQIITERLKLREIQTDDAASIYKILSNPDVIKYDTFDLFTDIKQAYDLIDWFKKQYKDKRSVFWGISLIDQSDIIGWCKCEIEVPKVRADLGYDLNPDYWNRDIMTESLKAIIEYVFRNLEINRIEATVSTMNMASIKVLEKLSFVNEGILRERSLFNGTIHDTVMFSMLKREYHTV